ncbi:MAG: NYN domain-containing protein [Clostridia bacterium]|nr:NYN domain-containing protein [Clostridia bacterium]
MKPLLLVDGYNVIGAWPEAREKGYALDESRDRLFHLLQDYAGYSGEEVVLVFDGHKSERRTRHVDGHPGASVVYTRQGETADSYIERQVYLCPKYRQVRVATNDALEQSQSLAKGATRVTAGELLRSLKEIRQGESRRYVQAGMAKKNPIASRLTAQQRDILERLRRGG